ncbi:MAG: SdpI family protein [Bifidobacterium angulatum]
MPRSCKTWSDGSTPWSLDDPDNWRRTHRFGGACLMVVGVGLIMSGFLGGIQMHVEHGFGPVWNAESRVLVLGSMPSPKSCEMNFYHGHPRNRFWPVMAAVFHDDSCLCENTDPYKQYGRVRVSHCVTIWRYGM